MSKRRVHLNYYKMVVRGSCLNACGCWSPQRRATDDKAKVTCMLCLRLIKKEDQL